MHRGHADEPASTRCSTPTGRVAWRDAATGCTGTTRSVASRSPGVQAVHVIYGEDGGSWVMRRKWADAQ